jgi:hypothetical protein
METEVMTDKWVAENMPPPQPASQLLYFTIKKIRKKTKKAKKKGKNRKFLFL